MAAANGAGGEGVVSNGTHPQSNGTYESVQEYYGRVIWQSRLVTLRVLCTLALASSGHEHDSDAFSHT